MKKIILGVLVLLIMFSTKNIYSQTTGQKVEAGIEAANDLLDILNGNDPQANYDSWKSYIAKQYPDYICMMNFSFYKKNAEHFCFFVPSKKTVFIFWATDNKKYRIPVLLDDTCSSCKIKGSISYNDLQTKALDYDSYTKALDAYRNYAPYLLFNKSYINWLVKVSTKTETVPIPQNNTPNQNTPVNSQPGKGKG